jgi:hypothetical protein
MSKVTAHVGLDHHKDSIQVCVKDPGGKVLVNRPCPNRAESVIALVAGHGRDVRAAVKACFGSTDLADEPASGMTGSSTWPAPAPSPA